MNRKVWLLYVTFNGTLIDHDNLVDSFQGEKSLNSNFLTWTGLRHAVPLNLRKRPHSFTVILDMENFKCRNYYSLLIDLSMKSQRNGPR